MKKHRSSMPDPLSLDHVPPISSDPPLRNTPASGSSVAAPPTAFVARYQAEEESFWQKKIRLRCPQTNDSVSVSTPVIAPVPVPVMVSQVVPSKRRRWSIPLTQSRKFPPLF